MAILKRRLNIKKSTGSYDTIHFETSSSLVLRTDGTTTVEASLSDLANSQVTGPSSSTDAGLAAFSGTGGKTLKKAATKGSATKGIYLNANGVPTAMTYSVGANVPSDAKFTDTTYTASDSNPIMNGTAAPGTSTEYSRSDHVHPADTSRAPKSHASTGTTYGAGTGTNYGHVKLSDATDGTSSTNGGTAATPAAVKAAYDLASGKADASHTHAGEDVTSGTIAAARLGTMTAASSSAAGASGAVPTPAAGAQSKFLRGDATWQTPTNTVGQAYCSTSASTAAKTASCTDYALLSKSWLLVTIKNANTVQGALTLNVNSKGAKAIYINGSASSSSNYTLPAGTYLVYYDGTGYQFRTDGKIPGTTTGNAPTSHASTGTGYGKGTDTNYGHLKLSDSTSSTSGVSGGIAATPAAVKASYDLATSKAPIKTATGNVSSSGWYRVMIADYTSNIFVTVRKNWVNSPPQIMNLQVSPGEYNPYLICTNYAANVGADEQLTDARLVKTSNSKVALDVKIVAYRANTMTTSAILMEPDSTSAGAICTVQAPSLVSTSDSMVSGETLVAKMKWVNYPLADNAGAHNAVYRGKNLGTSVTTEQWAAISAGTFDDMYIGDYWEINSMKWLIAGFDYWYHRGNTYTGRSTHHVVIVPYTALYNAPMNDTNTTEGAYVGSKMYTTNLQEAKTSVNICFGESHILKHRELLTNHVSTSTQLADGYSFYDSTVELMSISMLVGRPVWDANGHEQTVNSAQLPLFFFRPDAATQYNAVHDPAGDYWVRDVHNATQFVIEPSPGYFTGRSASESYGVRPVFGIC